ncbi:MAG: GNAT family N-acetyltransferase [Thermoplasmata archaeon]|nr:GNAT family N-acetyltransferase [Thermoplasmata archaeon]
MAAQGGSERGDERAASPNAKHSASAGRSPLVVERLTHLDVPDICALFKRVWDSFPDLPNELVKAWEPTPLEFTSWMEGVTYFAARRDGKMIGAIGCKITDRSCQLVHLAVEPESRRQAVATALTGAALEWARHNKTLSVWADALARFTAAAQLFKSLEFTECGVLHQHYWGEDVRLFEKIL